MKEMKLTLRSFRSRNWSGKKRETRREGLVFRLPEIQPVDILSGDLGIGADIEHVDALFAVPKVRNGLRDDAFCNPGLAEPHLVGDKEAIDAVRIEIKAPIGVLGRRALKIAQRPADLVGIGLGLSGHRRSASRALQIGVHTESKFDGRSAAPSSVLRRSATND